MNKEEVPRKKLHDRDRAILILLGSHLHLIRL